LNDLTQQCVAMMQPQAYRDRIIIRTSLPPSLPQVVADARSVRQIVLNLLSNSIKFTDAGGQVIVSTALNDNGDVALRVRDPGVWGIRRDRSRSAADQGPGGGQPRELLHQERAEGGYAGRNCLSAEPGAGGVTRQLA